MKKTSFIILLIMVQLGLANIICQTTRDLYTPFEVKQAYKKGTRSMDGYPGENYFQNHASYRIKAEFFPQTKILSGTEVIVYTNNSKDSLKQIFLNLFQNLYKKGGSRDGDANAKNIHDGVEVTEIIVNGEKIDPAKYSSFSTIFAVPLKNKITPLSESKIEIAWKQKMPETIAKRQGTYDETNFFVAYWYPKLCVYDDIEGWNAAGYTGQAEFYSDYADYSVEITVPGEYTVWSSGTLRNAAEIFTEKYLKRIEEASLTDQIIPIITQLDRTENVITKKALKHTWVYSLDNQMDFAFGVSKSYLWDGTSTLSGNKRVLINSVYNPKAISFNKVAEISQKSVQFYSALIPSIPFPQKQMTIFQGGPGGMEFPGMVNEEDYNNIPEMTMVTSHEIGHTYLPFYAGINEQKYGWMDEGIFTLLGFFAFSDLIGDKDFNFLKLLAGKYAEGASTQAADGPIMVASSKLGDFTYGYVTYIKSSTAFYLLYDYLGEDRFMEAVTAFLTRWKDKHPIPYDLFQTFNDIAGEDLAWFWKPWFFEFGCADLGIGKIETTNSENSIQIEKTGNYPLPLVLTVKYKDGSEKSIRKEMNIWNSGEKTYTLNVPAGEIREIILNNNKIPEASYKNNKVVF